MGPYGWNVSVMLKKRTIVAEDQSLWRFCYKCQICACLFNICATLFKILVALGACKVIRDFPPSSHRPSFTSAVPCMSLFTPEVVIVSNNQTEYHRGPAHSFSAAISCWHPHLWSATYFIGMDFIHLFIYFIYFFYFWIQNKTLLPLHCIQPSIGALHPFPWKVLYLCHNDIQSCDVVFTCGPWAILYVPVCFLTFDLGLSSQRPGLNFLFQPRFLWFEILRVWRDTSSLHLL